MGGTKSLYMTETLRYTIFRAFIWQIWQVWLTSCLFHFIFELLSVFMSMINIVKIELINANEHWLLNNFSIRNLFLSTELFLIHPIPIWSRSRGLDTKWTKILHDILSSNESNNIVKWAGIESCFINKTF